MLIRIYYRDRGTIWVTLLDSISIVSIFTSSYGGQVIL